MNFFNEHAETIINAAPTAKARAFAEKLVAQIKARGPEWIETHTDALQVRLPVWGPESVAPTADNRLFFLSHWQLALAA